MKNKVTPVVISKENGYRLFGILHEPKSPIPDIGIILLSPGIKGRVAPHRLYVKIAESFCKKGFPVLRFDPEGLGDSEGDIVEEWIADVYGTIEQGGVVCDTICAMDWMEEHFRVNHFILGGLCGGAITGLLAGAQDQRVLGLLGLGITCIVSGSKIDPRGSITIGQLESMRKTYIRKIFDPDSLKRLMTFKTDYRMLLKSLVTPISKKKIAIKFKKTVQNLPKPNAGSSKSIGSNFNSLFPKAFFRMVASRKIFLIFSGADRLYWEYQEKFAGPYETQLQNHHSNIRVAVVEGANHIFSFTRWQQEMMKLSSDWLSRNYGTSLKLSDLLKG